MSGNMTEALRRIKKNKETKSRVLDMSGLWLTELPEELWECVWVEELGLGRKYWNIEKEEWEWDFENKEYVNFLPSVPSKLHRLENLTTLILDGINIPEINFVVNLPNIKSLDISFNQYNDVSFLAQLPNLQNLDFSYNYISDDLLTMTDLYRVRNQNNWMYFKTFLTFMHMFYKENLIILISNKV